MHLHPSWNALVVSRSEEHFLFQCHLVYRLSATFVPNRWICYALYALAFKIRMFVFNSPDFFELFRRLPLNTLVWCFRATVQLGYSVYNTFLINRPPANAEWFGVSKVVAAVYIHLSDRLGWQWINHMRPSSVNIMIRIINKLFEKLSFKYVPVAFQPCLADLGWQCFQLFDVVWVASHQRFVICHKALDKAIFVRIFVDVKFAINK